MKLYDEGNVENSEEEVTITLDELNRIRKDSKELIDFAKSAKALANNKDFKSVIIDAYFTREPIRLGELLSSGKLNENQIAGVVQDMRAIGCFRAFMSDLIRKAELAQNYLDQAEAAYDEFIEAGGKK